MRPAPISAGLPRWPRTAFPAGLAPATARLRTRLLSRVGPDGAVRDPCHSRVLESALLLALLDRTRTQSEARDRLAAYLARHRDSAEALDRLLARTSLDGGPGVREGETLDAERFLRQAPDFTGARKRALLHAVLLVLGAVPDGAPPGTGAFDLRGLHSWARVQVTAVKAVLARPGLPDAADLELLRSTQRPGTVWEGNLLIHLSVLHALAPLPGQRSLVDAGIQTALRHQRPDGGMPFICDEDTWLTATAGLALHTAGAPVPVLDAVAERLLLLQRPGGGWSYTEGALLTDADCTSAAVELLHLAGRTRHRAAIGRAIAALYALRGADHGFPTYLAGAPSEACMTAAAANALSTQGHGEQAALEAALAHLASQQYPDGSFPPDWSSSRLHTVFRATLAALRHPSHAAPGSPAQRILRRATRLVLDTQNPDGGWGRQAGRNSDALSTAYALITLSAHTTDPRPAARAAAYLLTRQRLDGSIDSVPDSIGPRPFAFTVPALADTFTLLALGHLTHRLAPAASRNPFRPPPDPVGRRLGEPVTGRP